jgi:hypothetical protein
VIKGIFWKMTKKEISEWLERKEQEFSRQENINPRMSEKQWMQRYVYTDLHEIFFGEFPIILTEWLERLVEKEGRYRAASPRNWTHKLVRKMNYVSNPTTPAVDFWLDNILRGYIRKFAVDCIQLYNVVEMDFFKGPCGRFLK